MDKNEVIQQLNEMLKCERTNLETLNEFERFRHIVEESQKNILALQEAIRALEGLNC